MSSNNPDGAPAAPSPVPAPASRMSLAHRSAQEVLQRPLSESLQKLRRAQCALVRGRRKRKSKVRVSFRDSMTSQRYVETRRNLRQLQPSVPQKDAAFPQRKSVRQPPSSSHKQGGCLGSPSKPPPPPPKNDAADNGPPHDTMPESSDQPSVKPPKPKGKEHGDAKQEDAQASSSSKSKVPALKRHPVQAAPAPGVPRYSVFPRPTHQTRPSVSEKPMLPADPEHAESIRRSLSQQKRLSSLVPAENLPPSNATAQVQKPLPTSPTTAAKTKPVKPLTRDDPNSQPRSSDRILDKFARELEEFAKSTEAFSKGLTLTPTERAPVSTPTTTQTQISVRTVQELLPYRQQFQEAGLAVTSAEQKAPEKLGRHPQQQNDLAGDTLLKYDGNSEPTPVVSFTSKESRSCTTIHKPRNNPVSLTMNEEVPETKRKKNVTKAAAYEQISSDNQGTASGSSSTLTGTTNMGCVQEKAIGPRPSTVFLATEPLSTTPLSPQPSSSKGTRDASEDTQAPQTSGAYTKLQSSSGTERTQLLSRAEKADQAEQTTSSNSSTSKSSKGKELAYGDEKTDTTPPTLSTSRISSQVRRGVSLSSKTSWVLGTRQLPMAPPTTITEEKEPSPAKRQKSTHKLSIHQHSITIAPVTRTKEIGAAQTTASVKLSISSKPELLTETWKHALGTPSSLEKALDDVVRKLDAMEERRASGSSEGRNSRSKGMSSKPPSSTQRLQRATAIRQRRIAEGATREGDREGEGERERASQQLQPPVPKLLPPINSMLNAMTPPPPMPPPKNQQHQQQQRGSREPGRHMVVPPRGQNQLGCMPPEEDRDISDRDVLKGLKVICAASADADFDALIQNQTGLRLRRFLADLKTFEHLSENTGAGGPNMNTHPRMSRRRGVERRKRQAQAERESRRRSLRMMGSLLVRG
ncbi:hypothetical protein QBC35DRAFT_549711 [Podospora australis]|uniref:Uncharacterized protein n=1 Tax=Podospora australis TaxID=1536484 RepID=A0AAN7ANM9_9PEZI|nr:hypothetical protein QBC35DRAFT_549711 [Podospora australis]